MSDSSLGDSLFSYQSNRRYFGSTESCRFGFECRRCSLDGDKCSYSDNCRHGDRCRNCDCSSSYFSSDFDDTQNFSRRSSTRYSTKSNTQIQQHQIHNQQQYHDSNKYYEQKTTRYAEDFIKHVNNVKYNNQLAGGDDNLVPQQQAQRKIQHLYETIGDKSLVGAGHTTATTPSKRVRGIGSTSTVEYSSSSDTAMLGSGNGGRGKSSSRSRSKMQNEPEDTSLASYKSTYESHMTNESNLENKKYATINNGSNTKKSSNEAITASSTTTTTTTTKDSNSTMKRRRNKTTGTIPKLNTFDSATTTIQQQRINMRYENNRSEMNLSQYRTNDLYSSVAGHQQLGKLKRYQSDDIDRSNTASTGGIHFQTIEQLEHHPTSDNSIMVRAGGDKGKGDENSIIYEKGGDNDKSVKQSVGDDDEVFVNNLTYEMPKHSNRRVSFLSLNLFWLITCFFFLKKIGSEFLYIPSPKTFFSNPINSSL